jgi:3-deoxy-D-arabino-heptulosonate 7-phosphate (DAHP) synthase
MFTLALDNDSQELEIVAGPCSIDNNNLREVLEI